MQQDPGGGLKAALLALGPGHGAHPNRVQKPEIRSARDGGGPSEFFTLIGSGPLLRDSPRIGRDACVRADRGQVFTAQVDPLEGACTGRLCQPVHVNYRSED